MDILLLEALLESANLMATGLEIHLVWVGLRVWSWETLSQIYVPHFNAQLTSLFSRTALTH